MPPLSIAAPTHSHSDSDTPRREGAPRTYPHVTRKTLHSFANKNVNDDAEAIYTDAWKGYIPIQGDDTRHDTVNHSEEEWVVGDPRNNGIEGVRLLFKLSIVAAFDRMSKKHQDRYIEERKRRFNNRNNPHLFRKPSSASSRAIRYAAESWSSTRPPVFSLRQSIQAVRPGLISPGPLEGPRRGLAVCPCLPTAAPCLAARPRSARPAQLPRSGSRSTPRSWPFQP